MDDIADLISSQPLASTWTPEAHLAQRNSAYRAPLFSGLFWGQVPTMSLERKEASMQLKPSSTVADCDTPRQHRVARVDQDRIEFLGFLWIKILDTVPLDLDALDLHASGVGRFIKKGGYLPFLGVAWDPEDDSTLLGAPPADADMTVAKLKSSSVII